LDFAQIWYVGSLLVPDGPAIVEIHLPWNTRWRTAPNFQTLNGYNSGAHWSISLKFSTEFSMSQPIRWFKVKGSNVKVTAYITANTDSRQNVMFSSLFSAWARWEIRMVGGCHAELQNVRKQYFQTKQTRKTQNVWRDVVGPSRCNAFAIARFLVDLFYAGVGKCRYVCLKRL